MITPSQALTSWQQMFGEAYSLPETTLLLWMNIINRKVYDMMVDNNESDYITQSNFNLVVGQKAYSLPSDYRDAAHYGCGFFTSQMMDSVLTSYYFLEIVRGN